MFLSGHLNSKKTQFQVWRLRSLSNYSEHRSEIIMVSTILNSSLLISISNQPCLMEQNK